MSIGILYERSGTDEKGLKLTAEELGVDLVYIPFHKVAINISDNGYAFRSRNKNYSELLENTAVILNRAQSKNRRLLAANLLETLGKQVINPSLIEYICYSKLRTLLRFWKNGIKIPRTICIPCNPHELKADGSRISNEEAIADLIEQELSNGSAVIKPDAGTHGKDVKLANGRNDLLNILAEIEPSITNPIGILAQELIQKWFYDLRIIVVKQKGRTAYCYPTALARAGFKDFRTNTFLGNMVFDVKLPNHVTDLAVKCGKVIAQNSSAWLIALDAMIKIGLDTTIDDKYVESELEKLEPSFDAVKKVKNDGVKNVDFPMWNKKLETAFQTYKRQEAYIKVKKIIEDSMERNKYNILFHEANACPEFWEQTRLVAGINLAKPLIKCAQSVIG